MAAAETATAAPLATFFPESGLPEKLQRVEARLLQIVGHHGDVLGDHARSTISAGGKRLRPSLVFLCADWGRAADESLLRAAAAVELVHSATLVHDDVLDGAELRRGRPTVVATAGRKFATATGDLLFSRAFAELAQNECPDQVRILSDACAGLVEGELLQRADAFSLTVTPERYLRRCDLKTARLFSAACQLGAADGKNGYAFGQFGSLIGLAFQLMDDVLDVAGATTTIGKRRGADLLDGTVNLPLILARKRDPSLAGLDLRSITSVDSVCDAIVATQAHTVVVEQAEQFVEQAKESLPTSLSLPQRHALELVADTVVKRSR